MIYYQLVLPGGPIDGNKLYNLPKKPEHFIFKPQNFDFRRTSCFKLKTFDVGLDCYTIKYIINPFGPIVENFLHGRFA